jgi:predicted TIM-barrel fold metal-dependent hydrolase
MHTAANTQPQAPSAPPTGRLQAVDTNVSHFHWPYRRLPLDGTATLLEKMTEHGIAQAWAGSFEGILHRDLAGVNQRLADECRGSGGRLVAFGSVNPALPGWEDDLRRCREVHRMPGIRLHPNYHGYTLADPRFKRLLALSTERGLLVQLAVQLEDFRTHHPMMQVADVDVTPLPGLMPATPKARVLLLNSGKVLETAVGARLAVTPGVYFDIARIEAAGSVGRHLRRLPAGRLVFGTHAPLFIYESAVIKLYESSLTAAETRALLEENPRRLLQTSDAE